MSALLEHAHAATGLGETERKAAADDARADDNDIDVDDVRHIRERVPCATIAFGVQLVLKSAHAPPARSSDFHVTGLRLCTQCTDAANDKPAE